MAETQSLPNWVTQLNSLALSWYAVARQDQPVTTVTGTPSAGVMVTDRGITATADPAVIIAIVVVAGVLIWSLGR
jgi:hypothetical protein